MQRANHLCISALVLLSLVAIPTGALAQGTASFAQQRYERGVQLFDAHQYAEALDEFRASFELYQSPNSRLYMARSLRELGRHAEAVAEFETTAREASDRATRDRRFIPTQEAAERERQRLEPRIGRVIVTVANLPADARVLVSGRELPPPAFGIPMAVMPGTVAATVELDGRVLERREVNVTEGESVAIDLSLAPPPPPPPEPVVVATPVLVPVVAPRPVRHRPPASAIAAFGVGLGAAIASGVFAILAARTYEDLRLGCGGTPCANVDMDALRAGRNYQTAMQVALGVAAAGLITGAVLTLAGRGHERPPPVRIGFMPGAIVLTGVF